MLLRVAAATVAVVRGAGLLVVVGVVVLAHPGELLRSMRKLAPIGPAAAAAPVLGVLGLVLVVRGFVVRAAGPFLVPPPAPDTSSGAAIGVEWVGVGVAAL